MAKYKNVKTKYTIMEKAIALLSMILLIISMIGSTEAAVVSTASSYPGTAIHTILNRHWYTNVDIWLYHHFKPAAKAWSYIINNFLAKKNKSRSKKPSKQKIQRIK